MVVLDIHAEGIDRKKFTQGDLNHIVKSTIERGIPGIWSVPPFMLGRTEGYEGWRSIDREFVYNLGEAILVKGSHLGQQGLDHKCQYFHTVADSWHENRCLWNKPLSADEQREFMERGREILFKEFKVVPDVYLAPNHQDDETTSEVAEKMGYGYIMRRAVLFWKPYMFGNMMVIPESKLQKGRIDNAALYIHYDQIDDNAEKFKEVLRHVTKLDDVTAWEKESGKVWASDKLLRGWKRGRDVKRLALGKWNA